MHPPIGGVGKRRNLNFVSSRVAVLEAVCEPQIAISGRLSCRAVGVTIKGKEPVRLARLV